MASYHRQNLHANKKKISISYVIREKEEKCHRAGINSLQYDPNLNRLYSAGRDSVIRIWSDFPSSHSHVTNHNGYVNNIRYANNDCYVDSMEHHTDWVNDITLCCDGRNLLSVSNDTTIKVWNAHQGFCLSTLRSHKDYAKCLAYAKDREIVASAGFDRMIYLWDIQALTVLTATKNTVTTRPLDGNKNSIYSLAINQAGTLVASGSTEKVIRLWDPRSKQKLLKLRGHTDNVRSLVFSKDGYMLLSASSDNTIRLWSIPQQRCVSIIRIHDAGVWTLQANDSFSVVYSGGKDRKVFMTDLKNTSDSTLICEETAPILKLLLVDRIFSRERVSSDVSSSLWVATTDSAIKNWSTQPKHVDCEAENSRVSSNDNIPLEVPIDSSADFIIQGNPAVINYHVLNDKRHILTQESDNSIALYDVLEARKVETLHSADDDIEAKKKYDEEVKRRFKMVYVPNWFTVDLKIGLLCIHLDESECLSAWVPARDYGFLSPDESQDLKVNLGCLMLQALLEYWPPTYERSDNEPRGSENDLMSGCSNYDANRSNLSGGYTHKDAHTSSSRGRRSVFCPADRIQTNGYGQRMGNHFFSIASHTPIIFSECNQTTLRFLAFEACIESEEFLIQDMIPTWMSDIVINKCQPKFSKIPFFLLPHANSGIKSLRKERLSASDMLQMRKVIEHVCEKMIVNVTDESGSATLSQEQAANFKSSTTFSEQNTFPVEKVELYCNDQRLDENLDLRTVKHYIWKSGGDLVLHYMPLK